MACPLLAVITWQWQQLIQTIALLSRNPATLPERPPLSLQQLVSQRMSLGLPLLLLNPLLTSQPAASVAGTVAIQPEETAEQAEGTDLDQQVS